MSTSRGPLRFFCSYAAPPAEIELRFSLEVRRSKNGRPYKAVAQLASLRQSSTRQRLAFRQQLEIASNWSLTKYLQALQRWTESLSSTRSSRSYKQLRLPFGPLQRDQHRPVEPIRPEAHGHEGATARSSAGQRDRALAPDLQRSRKSLPGVLVSLRPPHGDRRGGGQRVRD